MTLDEFTDNYHKHVACIMDEDGFRLPPLHALDGAGQLTACALGIPPEQAYRFFWSIVTGTDRNIESPQYVIFGLDRTTRPGQGTEFADVLTCVCWWNDPAVNWGRSLKFGVINYQYKPRIVRPWDWENPFWNAQLLKEARSTRPDFRIKIERKEAIPRA